MTINKPKARCPFCGNTDMFQCNSCGKKMSGYYTTKLEYSYALLPLIKPPFITIDESAKEEFKQMMGWDEKEFNKRTIIILAYKG